MNLSTSNFSSCRRVSRQATWIALSLLVLFSLAEIGARKYARRREHDLTDPTDFTSINARAEQLMQQKGLKVVFVGNSAVQEGVDIPLFERLSGNKSARESNTSPLHATMCAASNTQIKDWYWMMQRNYWQSKRGADLFVIMFFSENMDDNPVPEVGRFAHFFTTPHDWPEVFNSDIVTLGQRSEFLLSYVSVLYAMRTVTQDKILRVCAPGYENYALQLNTIWQKQLTDRRMSLQNTLDVSSQPLTPNYETLKRLLARARKNYSKLCFVAYPRNGKEYAYKVNPEVVQLIRGAGMEFIDLRNVTELTPDKYRDNMHVNDLGRPVLTQHLSKSLAATISSLQSP